MRPTLSWSFVTILGTGALLDGVGRLGVRASLPVILVAVGLSAWLFAQTDGAARQRPAENALCRSSLLRRWWVQGLAALTSLLLLVAEGVRFIRRGSHDGFPIWLSDLFHEDNSTWILLGANTATGERLTPLNFGSGTALIQGAVNGLGVLFAWVNGIPASAVGIPVLGVGLSYVLLTAVVPLLVSPICRTVFDRTNSIAATLGVGAGLVAFCLRFMREARDLGHLTAGFTVLALLCATLMLTSLRNPKGVSVIRTQALWAFSFSCLLWFPLRPLSLVFAALALCGEFRILRPLIGHVLNPKALLSTLRATVFGLAVFLRGFPDLTGYVSPGGRDSTRKLIAATGGTYESFDFFILIAASLVGLVLLAARIGEQTERGVLATLSLYAIGIRFLDRFTNSEFQYGSTKMLWIVLPCLVFLSTFLLVRDMSDDTLRRWRLGGVAIVLSLLMANSTSFYGVGRSLGPLIWSEVNGSFSELDNPLAVDDITQWDEPGGIDLRSPVWELPIACIMVDEMSVRPLPLWEFEPYRCTRKVSEMSLEHMRDRGSSAESVEDLWKSYALMNTSLIGATMGSVNSGNDLSRPTLLLSLDGEILRSERTIDLLAQIALSDPVAVSHRTQWDEHNHGGALHNVDLVDVQRGRLDLWVENDVREIVLVGSSSGNHGSTERTPRPDVAELLGRDDLFAGVTIEDPAINEGLRCVVLVSRTSENTVAWQAGEVCE